MRWDYQLAELQTKTCILCLTSTKFVHRCVRLHRIKICWAYLRINLNIFENIFRFWEITKRYYELNKNGIAFLWGDRGLWSYHPKHIPFNYIHLVLRGSLRNYTGPYGTIKSIQDHMGPYRTIQDHTGSYGTIGDHTGSYGTIRDHRGPHGTIWDHTEP